MINFIIKHWIKFANIQNEKCRLNMVKWCKAEIKIADERLTFLNKALRMYEREGDNDD